MNPREMYYSHHWNTERQDRMEQIDFILNKDWGSVVCKAWDARHNNWQCITDTGLLFVLDTYEAFIVTMYIPRASQFYRVFEWAGIKPSKELVIRARTNHKRWEAMEEKNFKKVA